MGAQNKKIVAEKVFRSDRPLTLVERGKNAIISEDKTALKEVKLDFKVKKEIDDFLNQSGVVTLFRHELEDKNKCRINDRLIRGVARISVLFYHPFEQLPAVNDVMANALVNSKIKDWLIVNKITKKEIKAGLDLIEFAGFSFQKKGGLKRWVSAGEARMLIKKDKHGILAELGNELTENKAYKFIDATYEKATIVFFWVLGRKGK